MKFSLYDAPTGGTRLWTASGTTGSPASINVTVRYGLFTVQLGDTATGQNPFDFDWHQQELYLGVTVGADSEMTPRKRLTSVPYAFVAETLQGQYASSSVDSTGGALFALTQNATDAASGDRTTLFISTSGTSNIYDYLIKASNGTDVFTVSRQGHVTTTGNFASAGNVVLGNAFADVLTVNAGIRSNVLPGVTNAYSLGSSSYAWRELFATGINATNATTTNATSTNLYATRVSFGNATGTNLYVSKSVLGNATSTSLYVSGLTQLSSNTTVGGQSVCLANGTNCPAFPAEADTLASVTNRGNYATSSVLFYGGLTTSNLTATGTTSLQTA
ncbi:hypothetical protein L0Y59_05400, partial [Candidatus Uhrbacteria bacterium]|nr:hypothetical protein [Candidatus Uhrbacteria bacterium]